MSQFGILDWTSTLNASVITTSSESALENVLNTFVLPSQFTFRIRAKGAKFTLISANGQFVSPEAQYVLDLMTGLTQTESDAIVSFVNSEVSAGRWGTDAASYTDSLYDVFWCFGLTTEANALICWHPNNIITAINNGATKVSDGFDFSPGENDFLNSGYNPTANGVNYALNDMAVNFFVKRNDNTTGSQGSIGVLDAGNSTRLLQQPANSRMRPYGNGSANANFTSETFFANDSDYGVVRINATQINIYKNGTQLQAPVGQASTAIPNLPIYIGGVNTNGIYGDGFEGVLSSFKVSSAVGFNHTAYNSNLNTLLTSLGVLP